MASFLRKGFAPLILLIGLTLVVVVAVFIAPKYLEQTGPNASPSPTPQPVASPYDYSSLQFAVPSTIAKLLLTDEQGRQTGFDTKTDNVIENIPNTQYVLEGYYGDATSEEYTPPSKEGVIFLTMNKPKLGKYSLHIQKQTDNEYAVTVYVSAQSGGLNSQVIAGNFDTNLVVNYSFEYNEIHQTLENELEFQPE